MEGLLAPNDNGTICFFLGTIASSLDQIQCIDRAPYITEQMIDHPCMAMTQTAHQLLD
jgi:hypothetical protein